MPYQDLIEQLKGGAGSGNFGHAGIPGKVGGSAPGSGGKAIGSAFGSLGNRVHPDSINLRQSTKTVAKLAKFLNDNKSNLSAEDYKTLSNRGQKIMHNTSIVFRTGTPYNRAPGQMNRQALAKDLNDLAADIEAAIK